MGFNRTENNAEQNYFNNQLQFILTQQIPGFKREIDQNKLKLIDRDDEINKCGRLLDKDLNEIKTLTIQARELNIEIANERKERENLRKDCENRCDEVMAKYEVTFKKLKCQNQVKLDELTKEINLIINESNTGLHGFVIKICCFVSDIFTGLANRTTSCYDLGKNLMHRSYQNAYLERLGSVIVGVMVFVFSRKTNNNMLLCDMSDRKVVCTRTDHFIIGRANE